MREYWYRRWNIAEWYPLIAKEEAEIFKGKVAILRVENVELPENTIPVPLSIMRHALGTVIDVSHAGEPRRVEERKFITHAIFIPVFDGKIERGDLVGVLNAYYISTGERTSRLLQQLVRREEEANIVYRKDSEIIRKKFSFLPFSFKRSSIGKFEPIIAAESRDVHEGDVELIKIMDLKFPSGTIVQPLTAFNHVVGCVVDIASCEPKPVEEDRKATHAVVFAVKSGRIERGDLLGAIAVYNVSILREPEFFISRYREIFVRQ